MPEEATAGKIMVIVYLGVSVVSVRRIGVDEAKARAARL
jgi:hypothetical protein